MGLPVVILTHALPPDWITALNGRARLIVGPPDPPGFAPHLMEQLNDVEGIFCLLSDYVNEDLVLNAPRLRVVSNMAVGVDNIDLDVCTQHRIPVGNTPGPMVDAAADLTIGIMIAAARQVPQAAADARDGLWRTWSAIGWLGADMRDATLGIIGMGKIGSAVAVRAKGFGLNIVYADHSTKPEIEASLGAKFTDLDQLLRESDFISLHCPLTPETRDMIGEAELRKMKPTAILVNAARGPILQTGPLVRALREKWISAAALDVTDPEPLPPNHPLYDLPNCLIVPHIGSATRGTRRRMAEMACENLLAGLQGKPLPNCANPEVYKK
jgi:glyoxylate reductase